MRLINDQLKSELPAIGSTSEQSEDELMVVAKFFALGSAATWLVFEYDPESEIVFCYADLYGEGQVGGAEFGYTWVVELEELRWLGVPRVELDKGFKPRPFRECVNEEGRIIV